MSSAVYTLFILLHVIVTIWRSWILIPTCSWNSLGDQGPITHNQPTLPHRVVVRIKIWGVGDLSREEKWFYETSKSLRSFHKSLSKNLNADYQLGHRPLLNIRCSTGDLVMVKKLFNIIKTRDSKTVGVLPCAIFWGSCFRQLSEKFWGKKMF